MRPSYLYSSEFIDNGPTGQNQLGLFDDPTVDSSFVPTYVDFIETIKSQLIWDQESLSMFGREILAPRRVAFKLITKLSFFLLLI